MCFSAVAQVCGRSDRWYDRLPCAQRFPLCAPCSVCVEGSSIRFQTASPSAIRRISWPWTSYPTSLLYPFSVLAHVSFASESVDNLGLVIVGGNNYRLQMPGWLRKNTIRATCREPRPSWAPVEAECSNQMQVAQGQQGLVRDCALVQAAIGCAMRMTCNHAATVPATCTGGDFPQPTRHLLMCPRPHMSCIEMSMFCNLHSVVVVV